MSLEPKIGQSYVTKHVLLFTGDKKRSPLKLIQCWVELDV